MEAPMIEQLRQEPEWITDPFSASRVVIEGRLIPNLTARRDGDSVTLVVDDRLSVTIPSDVAYQVAWLVANAMAIGAGYPSLSAETKDRPFAPQARGLTEFKRD